MRRVRPLVLDWSALSWMQARLGTAAKAKTIWHRAMSWCGSAMGELGKKEYMQMPPERHSAEPSQGLCGVLERWRTTTSFHVLAKWEALRLTFLSWSLLRT